MRRRSTLKMAKIRSVPKKKRGKVYENTNMGSSLQAPQVCLENRKSNPRNLHGCGLSKKNEHALPLKKVYETRMLFNYRPIESLQDKAE